MAYDLRTRNKHNMYDMASMLQKSIRRCDFRRAGYAAMELFGTFHKYLWKRLVVISAEDCYGVITKEIVALKIADDIANEGRKGYDRDPLFVAKAITLLCLARKNRDGCYMACNFFLPDQVMDEDAIPHVDIEKIDLTDEKIPDWVFDVHTLKGKAAGKTDLDMTIAEQEALEPRQLSFFDDCSWAPYYEWAHQKGECKGKEWEQFQEFSKGKPDCPEPMDENNAQLM